MKYAHIKNGITNIIEVEPGKVAELQAAGLVLVDITGIDPQPQKGWLYNDQTGEFTNPFVNTKKWLHLTASSDEVIADNTDTVDITITIRQTQDPESAVVNYTGTERVIVNGFGAVKIPFANGTYTRAYKVPRDKSGKIEFRPADSTKYNVANTLTIWALAE